MLSLSWLSSNPKKSLSLLLLSVRSLFDFITGGSYYYLNRTREEEIESQKTRYTNQGHIKFSVSACFSFHFNNKEGAKALQILINESTSPGNGSTRC